jgi:type IV secretory pathway VirB2 component (pilin)
MQKRNEELTFKVGQLTCITDTDEDNAKRLMRITATKGVTEALAVVEKWAPEVVANDEHCSLAKRPGNVTNLDMMKSFVLDVVSYMIAIIVCVKIGITTFAGGYSAASIIVVLVLCFGFALASKYLSNRSSK